MLQRLRDEFQTHDLFPSFADERRLECRRRCAIATVLVDHGFELSETELEDLANFAADDQRRSQELMQVSTFVCKPEQLEKYYRSCEGPDWTLAPAHSDLVRNADGMFVQVRFEGPLLVSRTRLTPSPSDLVRSADGMLVQVKMRRPLQWPRSLSMSDLSWSPSMHETLKTGIREAECVCEVTCFVNG